MDRIIRDDRFHVYDAYNPTIGTGIAMAVQTSFDPLSALLSHWNPGTSQMHAVPMQLRLRVTNAGTGTSGLQVALVLDTIDRHSAGGQQLAAEDRDVGDVRVSNAEIHFGALTMVGAGTDAKRVAHRVAKDTALAVGDEFLFDFDRERGGIDLGKLVVGPGYTLVLHAWAPGVTAAPSLEVHWHWREVQKRS